MQILSGSKTNIVVTKTYKYCLEQNLQILSGPKHTNIVWTKTYKYCHANIVCNKTLCGPYKFCLDRTNIVWTKTYKKCHVNIVGNKTLCGTCKFCLDGTNIVRTKTYKYCLEHNLVWTMQILSGPNKYSLDQNIQIMSCEY